ncbi:heterokaryon incompatibility protein-domain-containing protein [Fusarium solani]|uniref:Heterokaryon incompatibility protein-domain-containing protein n=1 Tax=Fusarium solani TaxID=169388 RepID=A0A9P9H8R6_FUSSL|nr:heterokaryon incompatibility protein-domain-containing protein [Fusarium solani]KAH7253234.1 heterokaryon incompatibility protein-domain-containing protein [Fusarium solani]
MGLCKICQSILNSHSNDMELIIHFRMHDSWDSLCSSLELACPICWMLWRHLRLSPSAVPKKEERDGFSSYGELWRAFRPDQDQPPLSSIQIRCKDESHPEQIVTVLPVAYFSQYRSSSKSPFAGSTRQDCNALGSGLDIGQIRSWISQCSNGHERCRSRTSMLGKGQAEIPTRLLDLHGQGSSKWSLVVTNGEPTYRTYAALSHRWTKHVPQLKRENFAKLQSGEPDSTLPQDYQDVMFLCRTLDIQYIWIDSLCIFQDSPEDFRNEAAMMAGIYMNSLVTFSICWGGTGNGCLPKRDPEVIVPVEIPSKDIYMNDIRLKGISDTYASLPTPKRRMSFRESEINELMHGSYAEIVHDFYTKHGDPEKALLVDLEEWDKAVLESPINRRGWVYQERILSSRIVYLGNEQLYWECDQSRASEAFPDGLPSHNFGTGVVRARMRPAKKMLADYFHRELWPGMIEKYTHTDLTFESDRLVAFSGVAKLLSQRGPGDYAAGLWKELLLPGLHWDKLDTASPTTNPPAEGKWMAPSWSWASALGPVEYDTHARWCHTRSEAHDDWNFKPGRPLAQVKNTSIIPVGEDLFGSIKSGFIDMECLLIPAHMFGTGTKSDDKNQAILSTSPVVVDKDPGCLYLSCYLTKLSLDHELGTQQDIASSIYFAPLLLFGTAKGNMVQGLIVQEITEQNGEEKQAAYSVKRLGTFRDDLDDGVLSKFIVHTIADGGMQQRAEPEGSSQPNSDKTFLLELQTYLKSVMSESAGGSWQDWLPLAKRAAVNAAVVEFVFGSAHSNWS